MSGAASDTPAQRLAFDGFVLDLPRGCLTHDGREIALRPKTFAVLTHLVQHAGTLVSKDELLAAVWPNLVVTDDTVVQSIGELRRALAAAGHDYITTVPRRGYRFDMPVQAPEAALEPVVTPTPEAASPAPDASATPPPPAAAVKRALRWRWKYGIFAPLLLAMAVIATWYFTRGNAAHPEADARPAIAVLPFQDQGDDRSREYLADGLTQDIIHSLGRFSALTVMSWNAVATYKGVLVRPGEIARALDVRYQVEGSVRYAPDRVRVSAQLVDPRGRVLWSARYDEPLADLFGLQDRITREIAGALAIRVTQAEQQRVATRPTSSFGAYEFLLRARPALQRPTRNGIAEARSLLRQAIALDPDYAAPHSALGETFHIAISMGWAEAPDQYWDRVTEHATAALQLDDSDVRARILLGRRYIAYNQFDEAQLEIDRAILVNPSDADALAGRGNVLVWLGETDAAIESLEMALRIDPDLNAFDRFALSLAYLLKGRHAESIAQSELNLRQNEGTRFSRVVLAAALAEAGRTEEAQQAAEEIRRSDPTFDAATFGNKFRDAKDLARLRDGLGKAGLYPPPGA